MPNAISKDGSSIAYEKIGQGPAIIVVNGALSHRAFNGEKELAGNLSEDFTVFIYDRRGRGESTDTNPYSVKKEIEDIECLVDKAGGSAYLYGSSSGAALSLLAAEKLGAGKIKKLALYEPPYGLDDAEGKNAYSKEKKNINDLVRSGKAGEAVTAFLKSRGTPPAALEGMQKSPEWKEYERVGHTLVYDFEVLGDGTLPIDVARKIAIPVLVMDGEKSFDFVHATVAAVTRVIPGATHKTLKDQTHAASPEVLGPVLKEFFGHEKK